MAISANDIQALYIAYFNRPADFLGLKFWTEAATKAGSVQVVANEFSKSAEYTDLYKDKSPAEIIDTIYLNLFGRHAEPDGIAFWGAALQSGAINVGNAAYSILKGAQNADKIAIDSKVAAATAFYNALDTSAEIVGYAGAAANQVVKNWMSGIVDNATLGTATSAAGLAAVTAAAVAAHDGTTNVGQTVALTIGVDTVTGTAMNDTFNATPVNGTTGVAADTLGAFDSIDGGAGNDTLNIFVDGTNDKNITQAGTVTNVETINIYNDKTAAAHQFGGATGVDASKFVGATAIWQAGNANKVINLANGTTAGFKGVTAAGGAPDLSVSAAATATSVAVALDNVTADSTNNVVALGVSGKALKDISVAGSIVGDAGLTTAPKLTLDATIGKDVQAITVKTAVKTTLTLHEDVASTKHLTSVDASGSTGGVTYDASGMTTVSTITTGSGKDSIKIATALDTTTKAASVITNDGDDSVTITATGTAAAGNTAAINTGAGNDKISVAVDANIAYTVNGGAGDDKITISSGTVKTTDVIDGGDGADTIALAGKASYVADDYLVFTKVLKNFEAIEFTGTTVVTGFDASQVAGFKTFTFDALDSLTQASNVITKLAADQAVVTLGNLDATAAGYSGGTNSSGGGAGSATTYAGSLNITATADTSAAAVGDPAIDVAVAAKANSVALTVQAASDTDNGDVAVTLSGDVKSATVALANGVNGDDSFSVATLNLTTAATGINTGDGTGAYTSLGNLSSLTLTGNGTANITNATKLTSVDASALNSVNADGDAVTGLVYSSTNNSAETIKLGGGLDSVTLSKSTYGGVGATKMDTVSGLNFVLNSGGTALDLAKSDQLTITAHAAASTIEKFTTTGTDLDLVLRDAVLFSATKSNHDVVFQMGGNTYFVHDNAAGAGSVVGQLDATDTVVKIVGTVNLDTLIVALG